MLIKSAIGTSLSFCAWYQIVANSSLFLFQYRIGQLYSVAEASKNETGGREGMEIVTNEPFADDPRFPDGQYTYKIYYLQR